MNLHVYKFSDITTERIISGDFETQFSVRRIAQKKFLNAFNCFIVSNNIKTMQFETVKLYYRMNEICNDVNKES